MPSPVSGGDRESHRAANAKHLLESGHALVGISDAALALVAGIVAGQTALAQVGPAITRLRDSAAGMGDGLQPGPDDDAALAEMAELYTKQREREVHAAFAGKPEVAPATSRQELGDIFF